MILTIDVGNSNITLGYFENDELNFVARLRTDKTKTSDEYASKIHVIDSLHGVCEGSVCGACVSSVVPELTSALLDAVKMLFSVDAVLVGEEHFGGLLSRHVKIRDLGADLICGAVGAISKYETPCLVVDMGTATKILVIDGDGAFLGCTISPGVGISLDSLVKNASLLTQIPLKTPEHVVGTNTIECMQSGIVFGQSDMIDGLICRIKDEQKYDKVTVVETGGLAKFIAPCQKTEIILDENLLLFGLLKIFKEAKGENE